jgi:hypothetical protein
MVHLVRSLPAIIVGPDFLCIFTLFSGLCFFTLFSPAFFLHSEQAVSYVLSHEVRACSTRRAVPPPPATDMLMILLNSSAKPQTCSICHMREPRHTCSFCTGVYGTLGKLQAHQADRGHTDLHGSELGKRSSKPTDVFRPANTFNAAAALIFEDESEQFAGDNPDEFELAVVLKAFWGVIDEDEACLDDSDDEEEGEGRPRKTSLGPSAVVETLDRTELSASIDLADLETSEESTSATAEAVVGEVAVPASSSPASSSPAALKRTRSVWYDNYDAVAVGQQGSGSSSYKCKRCGETIRALSTDKLKKHFETRHPFEFKIASSLRKGSAEQGGSDDFAYVPVKKQTTIEEAFKSKKAKMRRDDPRAGAITNKLALWISQANIPLQVVEDQSFVQLLEELRPDYELPSRRTLVRHIGVLFAMLLGFMKEFLDGYKDWLCLSYDSWTDPLHRSVLGVVLRVKTPSQDRALYEDRPFVQLNVAQMYMSKEILGLTGIRVAAEVDNILQQIVDSPNGLLHPLGAEALEDLKAHPASNWETKSSLLKNARDIYCVSDGGAGIAHAAPFLAREKPFRHCVVHQAQLVSKAFVQKDPTGRLPTLFALGNSLSQSSHLSSATAQAVGIMLTGSETRFNSIVSVIGRLPDHEERLRSWATNPRCPEIVKNAVLQINWPLAKLFQDFVRASTLIQFSDILSGDGVTSSAVIPRLLRMQSKLDAIIDNVAEPAAKQEWSRRLKELLNHRYDYVFHDDIYLIACLVDKRYHFGTNPAGKFALNNENLARAVAKLKSMIYLDSPLDFVDVPPPPPLPVAASTTEPDQDDDFGNPDMSVLLNTRPALAPQQAELFKEVDDFVAFVPSDSGAVQNMQTPMPLLKSWEALFPRVACIARRVFCVPCNEISVERQFSHSGNISARRRASLAPETAQMLTLLHANKGFFERELKKRLASNITMGELFKKYRNQLVQAKKARTTTPETK